MDSQTSYQHNMSESTPVRRSTRKTQYPIDAAARIGNLEEVKRLSAIPEEIATDAAMNKAIDNGHLAVVKWLNENRNEGCSRIYMERAFENAYDTNDDMLWAIVAYLAMTRPWEKNENDYFDEDDEEGEDLELEEDEEPSTDGEMDSDDKDFIVGYDENSDGEDDFAGADTDETESFESEPEVTDEEEEETPPDTKKTHKILLDDAIPKRKKVKEPSEEDDAEDDAKEEDDAQINSITPT